MCVCARVCVCVCVCVCVWKHQIERNGGTALLVSGQLAETVWSSRLCLARLFFGGLRGLFGEILRRGMGINFFSSLGDRFYLSVVKSIFLGGSISNVSICLATREDANPFS